MKLSEAIREGAKLRPHGVRFMFPNDGSSCALGAAYEATYGHTSPRSWEELCTPYPELCRRLSSIPSELSGRLIDDLRDCIVLLNDDLKWTREQIADWLEGQGY